MDWAALYSSELFPDLSPINKNTISTPFRRVKMWKINCNIITRVGIEWAKLKCCVFRPAFGCSRLKSLKKLWNEQKRLKNSWKNVLTSFWVCAAPKSWLKYTTLKLGLKLSGFKLPPYYLHLDFLEIELYNKLILLLRTAPLTSW